MSVFSEPLVQARENVDHAEALLTRDPFGEAERSLAATLLREALAAIERAETPAAEMEKALRPFVEDYDFHAADYLAELVDGEEARVLTARTVESLMAHQRAARAVLSAREEAQIDDECPRGGTHARITHPGGRCIKCGASGAREEAQ